MKLNAPFSDDNPRALILGNGSHLNENQLINLVKKASFIVCVNGGSEKAKDLKINPDIILGDLDSINQDIVKYFNNLNIPIVKIPSQEKNDLEKAILYLLKKGYERIILCGFLGKRVDQTIASLQVVKKYIYRAEFQIFSKNSELFLLKKGEFEFQTIPRQTISLFGFHRAIGISTEGLKFPLKNENLLVGSRGISNQATLDTVSISMKSGTLLVVKINFVI
ncbi:MAG: thiamine diphosphokinase [Candidatus Marinimicrobia bacterium]|nr:thiamine diphosphokinase [Candidatus Neomarinimicrobiota bacterium]